MDPSCERDSVVFWGGGPRDKPVSAFSSKELTVGPTGRQVHPGRQHNKTTGGPWLERREGLDQRRGKIFAKSIRWAEWDENTETD